MSLHDRILVATDLSAQSDRALDRAATLAREDGSNLVVLHVTNARHHVRDDIREKLLYDLGDCAARATIRIEDGGSPAATIERVATEEASTLVVAGMTHRERLGSYMLGSTAERLTRTIHAPLLLVSERPRGPYERIAVTTDFSPMSQRALELTVREFEARPITAFHAYEPLVGYGASNLEAHRDQTRRAAELAYLDWLRRADISPRTRDLIRPRIVFGEPAHGIRAAATEFDLVVLATRGRGRIFELIVGSMAKRMLAELPCDALLLRIPQVTGRTAVRYTSELT
jgi:nucleotide-binding universal stress UspA family protein